MYSSIVLILIYKIDFAFATNEIMSPNQKIFGYPQTMTSTNKNDSIVLYFALLEKKRNSKFRFPLV